MGDPLESLRKGYALAATGGDGAAAPAAPMAGAVAPGQPGGAPQLSVNAPGTNPLPPVAGSQHMAYDMPAAAAAADALGMLAHTALPQGTKRKADAQLQPGMPPAQPQPQPHLGQPGVAAAQLQAQLQSGVVPQTQTQDPAETQHLQAILIQRRQHMLAQQAKHVRFESGRRRKAADDDDYEEAAAAQAQQAQPGAAGQGDKDDGEMDILARQVDLAAEERSLQRAARGSVTNLPPEPTFVDTEKLLEKITAIAARAGIDDVDNNTCNIISCAVQERLRDLIDRLVLLVHQRASRERFLTSRIRVLSTPMDFVQKEMRRADDEQRSYDERKSSERRGESAAEKERQARLRASREEQMRSLASDNTAHLAIGGKKRGLASQLAGLTSSSQLAAKKKADDAAEAAAPANTKTVTLSDCIALLQQEARLRNSQIMHSAMAKLHNRIPESAVFRRAEEQQ